MSLITCEHVIQVCLNLSQSSFSSSFHNSAKSVSVSPSSQFISACLSSFPAELNFVFSHQMSLCPLIPVQLGLCLLILVQLGLCPFISVQLSLCSLITVQLSLCPLISVQLSLCPLISVELVSLHPTKYITQFKWACFSMVLFC